MTTVQFECHKLLFVIIAKSIYVVNEYLAANSCMLLNVHNDRVCI